MPKRSGVRTASGLLSGESGLSEQVSASAHNFAASSKPSMHLCSGLHQSCFQAAGLLGAGMCIRSQSRTVRTIKLTKHAFTLRTAPELLSGLLRAGECIAQYQASKWFIGPEGSALAALRRACQSARACSERFRQNHSLTMLCIKQTKR